MNVSKILEAIYLNVIVGGKMKPASCILNHNGVLLYNPRKTAKTFNSSFQLFFHENCKKNFQTTKITYDFSTK